MALGSSMYCVACRRRLVDQQMGGGRFLYVHALSACLHQ